MQAVGSVCVCVCSRESPCVYIRACACSSPMRSWINTLVPDWQANASSLCANIKSKASNRRKYNFTHTQSYTRTYTGTKSAYLVCSKLPIQAQHETRSNAVICSVDGDGDADADDDSKFGVCEKREKKTNNKMSLLDAQLCCGDKEMEAQQISL